MSVAVGWVAVVEIIVPPARVVLTFLIKSGERSSNFLHEGAKADGKVPGKLNYRVSCRNRQTICNELAQLHTSQLNAGISAPK